MKTLSLKTTALIFNFHRTFFFIRTFIAAKLYHLKSEGRVPRIKIGGCSNCLMPTLKTLQSCYRGISESIHCPHHSSLKNICILKNAFLILQWYNYTLVPREIMNNLTSFSESVPV